MTRFMQLIIVAAFAWFAWPWAWWIMRAAVILLLVVWNGLAEARL